MDTIEKALQKQKGKNITDGNGSDSDKYNDDKLALKTAAKSVNNRNSIESMMDAKSREDDDKLLASSASKPADLSSGISSGKISKNSDKDRLLVDSNLSKTSDASDKATELIGFPIVISDEDLLAHRLIVPNEERSTAKEQYRHIKRSILDKAFNPDNSLRGKFGNLVMVTSACPGEGKTFTAINLALSIALEQDRKILLVDADVVQPSVAGVFNVKEALGITDYLIDQDIEFDRILHKTNVANLTMVLAGKPHHLTNELLASDSMKKLMYELATRYPDRIVMFDTPPLCHTTEAAIMASLVGQVIVVVEEGKTTDRRLKEALKLVSQHDDVSLLMNKCSSFREGSYYGYY